MYAIKNWLFVVAMSLVVTVSSAAGAESNFSGIDPDGFDPAVRPQDDLYRHVNGRWLLRTEIPNDKSNYGSFTVLIDEAQSRIREIIEESAKDPTNDTSQKIGDFFNSYMNEERVEELGLQPLQAEIDKVAKIADKDQVLQQFGYNQTIGVGGPIGFFTSIRTTRTPRNTWRPSCKAARRCPIATTTSKTIPSTLKRAKH